MAKPNSRQKPGSNFLIQTKAINKICTTGRTSFPENNLNSKVNVAFRLIVAPSTAAEEDYLLNQRLFLSSDRYNITDFTDCVDGAYLTTICIIIHLNKIQQLVNYKLSGKLYLLAFSLVNSPSFSQS